MYVGWSQPIIQLVFEKKQLWLLKSKIGYIALKRMQKNQNRARTDINIRLLNLQLNLLSHILTVK